MICKSPLDFDAVHKFLNENDKLALDIETSGLNTRKDTIIGFGFSNATDGIYIPLKVWDGQALQEFGLPSTFITEVLHALKAKKLLTWNGSFDLPFIKNKLQVDLLDALHADVLLMKHTCDEEFPFGLKEVATKLWGHNVTEEKQEMLASIKAAGGSSKEYYKASTETLAKYCIQDCLLTFKCYNYYSQELQKQGLESFYYDEEVMPLYKHVTIPMEQKGVGLDVAKLNDAQRQISADIQQLEQNIQDAVAPMLDIFTAWFLNKDYPPQTPTGKQPTWAKKGLTQTQAFKADNPDQPYMFNLQSKFHLKKLFFDTLKEQPLSRTPTGMPQVDEDFLLVMAKKYTWAADLISYNKLCKIKSTYIDRFVEECENGIFYPSFMQHRTVSGRYGSDLQQLPRPLDAEDENNLVAKYTNFVRQFITAIPGHKLISADYEQLEPSVFAHNSGDPALIAIFNSGVDFYSEVAIRTEGLTDVSSEKSSPTYLGKIDKKRRQKAKSYALGIAYGMTAYKLKFEIEVSEQEADKLVKDYYAAFPKLKTTMDDLQSGARTVGRVQSHAGRVRRMPHAVQLYRKYGACISNGLDLWKKFNEVPALYAAAKLDAKTYKNLMNNALNFPIQSLAASIVNRACIAIAKAIKEQNLDAYICMQIHDEIVVMASEAHTEIVSRLMQAIMQNVVKLTVPLRASPIVGQNFAQCK